MAALRRRSRSSSAGDVELLADGHARVASQCQGTTVYRLVNGTCDCPDFARAPSSWCKHRIAAGIQKRASALLAATNASTDRVTAPCANHPSRLRHDDSRQGIRTVRRAPGNGACPGAHQFDGGAGLRHPRPALAKATATFADGRSFTEAADAIPDNVNTGVRKHFARCALTRAKARALRDALNISTCAVEELD